MNAATKQPCREIVVSGVGHTRFGRLDEEDVESLVAEAVRGALADADVPGDAVDAIFFGNFNAGMQPLAFGSSLALQADDGLLGVPATRVENACASGSAAVHHGNPGNPGRCCKHCVGGRGREDDELIPGNGRKSVARR